MLLAAILLNSPARAQQQAQARSDQRTVTTKIADVLAKLPANDAKQLDAAMNDIAGLGESGITDMVAMLAAPGNGDNTGLEYAIGGFSRYVMQKDKEDWRQMAAKAYCQALEKTSDKENKAFIIKQLQNIAKDETVSYLQAYLQDERLCDPAARALIKVNSAQANKVLLTALQNAQGTCRLSLVEALGDSRVPEAATAITPLASNEDKKLKKLALYALANIADPASEAVLAKAAQEASFVYDVTNATASYLYYSQRLTESGKATQAEKIAQTLLSTATGENQIHTRTAALKLLTSIQGEKSMPLLLHAATDKNPEYRAAALKFAAPYVTPSTTTMWLTKLKKAEPQAQAEIITMLGKNKAETALPTVLKALKDKNKDVKLAAIGAAGRLGQDQVLPQLLELLKKGTPEEITAVQQALLTMKGSNVVSGVANALPQLPAAAQASLIFVLGARGAHERVKDVFSFVKNRDTTVRMAALKALHTMVNQDNLPQLFTLLDETSQVKEVQAIQQAVIAATKDSGDQAQQATLILQQMEKVSVDKKPMYFPVLASIGGKKSLDAVAKAFATGDASTKTAAVVALSKWTDAMAASELYRISQQPKESAYLDQALKGYVNAIKIAPYAADQKLLMLRNAMEVAKTSEQKKLIVREVERNKTFPALLFAGKYLTDADAQQEAAQAVMNIALSDNKAYYGTIVKDLLTKTIDVLKGQDSEYQKESIRKFISEMPEGEGFVSLFNGKDLSGWKGLVADPIKRSKMDAKTLAKEQAKADEEMRTGWKVENGELLFTGKGNNLATVKKYGDIEMFVDWKIYDDGHKDGDAGIYLRGTPQVQIWDTSRVKDGAQVGSGGLYNNQKNESKPLKVADNPLGEWNTFRILMKGDRVTVYLNGELVTDNVILENYWDRNLPIFAEEQIELQAHGSRVAYRDIYVREISRPKPYELTPAEKKEGFKVLFDGTNMHSWMGNTTDYVIEDGTIAIYPDKGGKGNLYTKDQYSDFAFRFEFKLTPGANNGLGIRAPLEGDAAYTGMELQILDNEADIYKTLQPYQYHGSVYGVLPAKRGFLKPVGEWNEQEVIVKGPKIKVILNGTTILDGDLTEARKKGTADGKDHPGIQRTTGHIGFLGHGNILWFRNIRIKDMSKK
jgi:HEAT repeat protein